MATKKKTEAKGPAMFTPYMRFKTVSYLEEGAPKDAEPFDIKMRSNLTMEEIDELVNFDKSADTADETLFDRVAPHIAEWPFHDPRTGDPIPPPCEGGGQVFKKVPIGVFRAVLADLISVNMGRVDPKS